MRIFVDTLKTALLIKENMKHNDVDVRQIVIANIKKPLK